MSSRSDFTECVGDNIRRLRLAKGLTQWQLGKLVGYSEFTVCRNEKGEGLSADSLNAYASGLGCSIEELIVKDDQDPIIEFENTVDSVRKLPKNIISNVTTMMKSAVAIYRTNYGSAGERIAPRRYYYTGVTIVVEKERKIMFIPNSEPEESEPKDKLVAELLYCVADLYISLDIPFEGYPICAAPIFDFAEQIGTRIRMNRIRRNMTQQKLATMMHMDKSTISRNERGLSLTLDAIPQYAMQLGCTVHDLIPDYDYISDEERSFDKVIEQFRLNNHMSNEDMESLLLKTALFLHEHKGLTQEQVKRYGSSA